MATVVYNLESSQPTGCVSSRKGCPPAFRCPPNRELSTDWRCPVNRGSAVMKQKMDDVSNITNSELSLAEENIEDQFN